MWSLHDLQDPPWSYSSWHLDFLLLYLQSYLHSRAFTQVIFSARIFFSMIIIHGNITPNLVSKKILLLPLLAGFFLSFNFQFKYYFFQKSFLTMLVNVVNFPHCGSQNKMTHNSPNPCIIHSLWVWRRPVNMLAYRCHDYVVIWHKEVWRCK